MLDYRNYGKSSGRPNEPGLHRDSEAGFICLLDKGYQPEQIIIIHAESLCSAVAAIDLASRRPCAALIVEALFTSASDVAGTLLPWIGPLLVRSYNSLPKMGGIRLPMLFTHCDRDKVIRLRLGQELFAAALDTTTFWKPLALNIASDCKPSTRPCLTSARRRPRRGRSVRALRFPACRKTWFAPAGRSGSLPDASGHRRSRRLQ
jgi:fermentation-respiration switch protein FrsA (DUF1100 family)